MNRPVTGPVRSSMPRVGAGDRHGRLAAAPSCRGLALGGLRRSAAASLLAACGGDDAGGGVGERRAP